MKRTNLILLEKIFNNYKNIYTLRFKLSSKSNYTKKLCWCKGVVLVLENSIIVCSIELYHLKQ